MAQVAVRGLDVVGHHVAGAPKMRIALLLGRDRLTPGSASHGRGHLPSG